MLQPSERAASYTGSHSSSTASQQPTQHSQFTLPSAAPRNSAVLRALGQQSLSQSSQSQDPSATNLEASFKTHSAGGRGSDGRRGDDSGEDSFASDRWAPGTIPDLLQSRGQPSQAPSSIPFDPDPSQPMYTQVQYDRSYLSPGPDSLDDSIEEDRRRWNADDEGLVATQLATQSQSLRTIGAESLESRKSKQESLSLQTESQAKELLVPDSQPASLEHRPTSFANRSGFIKRSHLPILNVPSSDGDVVPGTSPSSHSPRHQPSSSGMVDDAFRLLPTASTSSPRTSPRKTTLTAFTASTSGAKSPSRSAFGSAVGESAFPSVAQSPTGRPSSSGTVRPSNLTLQSSPEKEDDLSDGEEITFASTYRRTVSKPSSPFRPLPPAPALKREPMSDDIPDVSGRKAKVNPSEAFQSVVDLGSELNDQSDIAASSEDEGLAAQQRRRKAEKEGQLTLPMQKLMQRQVEFNASLSSRPSARTIADDDSDLSSVRSESEEEVNDSLGPFTYKDEPPPKQAMGKGKAKATAPPVVAAAGKGKGKRPLSVVGQANGMGVKRVKQEKMDDGASGRKKAAGKGKGRVSIATNDSIEDDDLDAPPSPPQSRPSAAKIILSGRSAPAGARQGPVASTSARASTRARTASVAPPASTPSVSRRVLRVAEQREFTGPVDRVFALWIGGGSKDYYTATVTDVGHGGDFRVDFDDHCGLHLVNVKNMRRANVKRGDVLISGGQRFEVQETNEVIGGLESETPILLKGLDRNVVTTKKLEDMFLAGGNHAQMDDRRLEMSDILVRGRPTTFDYAQAAVNPIGAGGSPVRVNAVAGSSRAANKRSAPSNTPKSGTTSSRALVPSPARSTRSANGAPSSAKVFSKSAFVFSNMKDETKQAAKVWINSNGGQVFNEIDELYAVSRTSAGNTKEGTYLSTDLKFLPDFRDLTGIFLVGDGPSRRPKYFRSLALGIPCLATSYIQSAIEVQEADRHIASYWRAFALATPRSLNTNFPASQGLIQPTWGQTHDLLLSPHRAPGRPFAGLDLLYIQPQRDEREFVIFLSLALGAESITVASAPKKLDNFDFIIIRDNTPVPPELEELDEGTVVDEEWVKQSAIVGCQVAPSLWRPDLDRKTGQKKA